MTVVRDGARFLDESGERADLTAKYDERQSAMRAAMAARTYAPAKTAALAHTPPVPAVDLDALHARIERLEREDLRLEPERRAAADRMAASTFDADVTAYLAANPRASSSDAVMALLAASPERYANPFDTIAAKREAASAQATDTEMARRVSAHQARNPGTNDSDALKACVNEDPEWARGVM